MKSTLLLLACVTALLTSLAVPDELFLSALEARLFLLGQAILIWELWCRKESWKVLSIHVVALCFLFSMSFSMSTATPNQAPNFFIIFSCLFLGIVIMIVNPEKHQRSLMNPSPTPIVDDFSGIEWSQLPMFAPQIFTITDPDDSDLETKIRCFSLFLWLNFMVITFTGTRLLIVILIYLPSMRITSSKSKL